MKRFIVLGLVLAILAVGFTAFADPIVVGGSWAASSNVGEDNESLRPGNAYGILNRPGNAYGIVEHWGGLAG